MDGKTGPFITLKKKKHARIGERKKRSVTERASSYQEAENMCQGKTVGVGG